MHESEFTLGGDVEILVRSNGLSGSGYGRRSCRQLSRQSRDSLDREDVDVADLTLGGAEGFPTPSKRAIDAEPSVGVGLSSNANENRVDLILLLAKCSVPALFIGIAGVLAVPANGIMNELTRTATREIAGGALIVTYAFELTKGYTLHSGDGNLSMALVLWSFFGTLASCQIQAAAQGMWPYGSGAGEQSSGWGDAVPFAIGFFVVCSPAPLASLPSPPAAPLSRARCRSLACAPTERA